MSSPAASCWVSSVARPARPTAVGSIATYGVASTWRPPMAAAEGGRGARRRRAGRCGLSPSISSGRGTTVSGVALAARTAVTVCSRVAVGVVDHRRAVGPQRRAAVDRQHEGHVEREPARRRRRGARRRSPAGPAARCRRRSSMVTGYMPASGSRALPPCTRSCGVHHGGQGDGAPAEGVGREQVERRGHEADVAVAQVAGQQLAEVGPGGAELRCRPRRRPRCRRARCPAR